MRVAIERHTDAKHLNEIVNHPEVYPWVRGAVEGPIDLGPWLDNDNVVALLGEYGGQIYQKRQAGLWEAHSQYLPEGRGEWALEATRQTLHWVFTRTDAVELVTRCPQGNFAAKALAKAIGGTYELTNPSGWVMYGRTIPADIYSLKIQDWMRAAPSLVERGKWFHERLAAEVKRHGEGDEGSAQNDTGNRCVGAVFDMLAGGQPMKAQIFHGRYAAMSGCYPLRVASADPLIVDLGSALIIVRDDDFFVPATKQISH